MMIIVSIVELFIICKYITVFESSRKKKCEEDGLLIRVCANCHTMSENSIHRNSQRNLELKQYAQRKYEENHTREEFIKRYRKSYLEK